jgi:hypothetical protein
MAFSGVERNNYKSMVGLLLKLIYRYKYIIPN